LFEGKSSYGDAYLWVYCNEDSFWFKHCEGTETWAILAYETEDIFFNNWYITFCPTFFNPADVVPFDQKLELIRVMATQRCWRLSHSTPRHTQPYSSTRPCI
jgi:hypothetical protein